MPEGRSIVILREQLAVFDDNVIRCAEGNAKFEMARLPDDRVCAVRHFGKQFLIDRCASAAFSCSPSCARGGGWNYQARNGN